jgi:hypothetical protein
MTPPSEWVHHVWHLGLLRGASLLVPARQRAEWWREWSAELWHVRQACAPAGTASWAGEREVTAFCLGAFQDAFCLRRHGFRAGIAFAAWQGSAAHCVVFLAAALTASCALAHLLPGVRAELTLPHQSIRRDLVAIQNADFFDRSSATILPAQYHAWKEQEQPYFDGFAFYRVTRESIVPESAPAATPVRTAWGVAHASANVFALLGLPVLLAVAPGDSDGNLPRLVLSDVVWKREFGADPHIAGTVVRMGERRAVIAGVAPDGSWGLPGQVGAWLLQPDADFASGEPGFAIAHLTAAGKAEMWAQCVRITAYGPHQSVDDLLGVALEERAPSPWTIYLFAAFLALLALPAITSVSLGEYSISEQRTTWSRKLYSWSFLSAKIALLLPIFYFVSLDLAYGRTTSEPESGLYIQLVSCFFMVLFGMRWALRDQRQRCPVCLRCVEHPAQVGQASRTFLAWNGTELMCMDGHTLLHVPGIPTSWFSTQRWLYLDTSWEFLFVGPGAGMEPGTFTGFSPH